MNHETITDADTDALKSIEAMQCPAPQQHMQHITHAKATCNSPAQ